MIVKNKISLFLITISTLLRPLKQDRLSTLTLAKFGDEKFSFPERRFLLYDVNPGEGFNLRRDVYMRIANTVRQLRERGYDFILVLPPWRKLWHWRNQNIVIPWHDLFEIRSLSAFVPVIEFDEFIENYNESINLILYLQHYAEGWSDTEGFVPKYDIRPCLDAIKYNSKNESSFFGRKMLFDEIKCLSIQGQSSTLADAITQLFPKGRSIMVDRAETILHDRFGDEYYWQSRKSMSYAKSLKLIAAQFLNENFSLINQNNQSPPSNYNSNEYICLHLRRRDFIWSHPEDIPSIKGAVRQVIKLANLLKLKKLFICTDAELDEVKELTNLLNGNGILVRRFDPNEFNLSEAAIVIIEQIICSYAGYFVGTHQSTFSFRIHEDREILGMPSWTTFNRLCADGQDKCEQPTKWTIIMND